MTSVRIQTLLGAALVTALDVTLAANAFATRNVAPALLAAGATIGWLLLATLAWRSAGQRRR